MKHLKKMSKALEDRELEHVVGGKLSKDAALNTVLSHAKLLSDQIRFCRITRNDEQEILIYNIEFVSNGMLYEYGINAETGEIIKAEKDYWD